MLLLYSIRVRLTSVCLYVGNVSGAAHTQRTSVSFHEAGWGVPGLETLNVPFLETVALVMADTVAKIDRNKAAAPDKQAPGPTTASATDAPQEPSEEKDSPSAMSQASKGKGGCCVVV
eukprot:m.766421 g.766421  ORF g.766421 m.766421 type:complete len:118 (+) comp23224_c0_seq19:1336-1689(+)